MSCATIRDRIHDWMDQPGAATMPEEVSQHVHGCADCRAFIKRWNSIELRMQSMRTDGPSLPAGFRSALYERIDAPRVRPALLGRGPGWRFVLVSAGATAAVAGMLYLMMSLRLPAFPAHQASNSVSLIQSRDPQPGGSPAAGSLPR